MLTFIAAAAALFQTRIQNCRLLAQLSRAPADLDNLAALHLHQLAQVLLQEAGVGAPLQQAKEVHCEETTARLSKGLRGHAAAGGRDGSQPRTDVLLNRI